MKFRLLFSTILTAAACYYAHGQDIEITPYLNATTSIEEGQIEFGPEIECNRFSARLTARMPLTDKDKNILQVDRYTSTGRGILLLQWKFEDVPESSPVQVHAISVQFETARTKYEYYPTGDKDVEKHQTRNSYALEGKYQHYWMQGIPNGKQALLLGRVRYSSDWKAADEVGVVSTRPDGLSTTSSMVVDAPTQKPVLSPAVALAYYPGSDNLLFYVPAIYYDFVGTGKRDDDTYGSLSPLGKYQRLRLEAWVFYAPIVLGSTGLKIGIAPFWSVRTTGSDNLRKNETGMMLTVKIGSTFQQFF
jgi:hypothetical protein